MSVFPSRLSASPAVKLCAYSVLLVGLLGGGAAIGTAVGPDPTTPSHSSLDTAPPVTAVDTTAAGDCFNGALATALAENCALHDAVAFACKAASIAVTRMGAQASMPHRHELDALPLLTV